MRFKFNPNPITAILCLLSLITFALGHIFEGCIRWKLGCYNNGTFVAIIILFGALYFLFIDEDKSKRKKNK